MFAVESLNKGKLFVYGLLGVLGADLFQPHIDQYSEDCTSTTSNGREMVHPHLQLLSGISKSLELNNHALSLFLAESLNGSQKTFGASAKEKPWRSQTRLVISAT